MQVIVSWSGGKESCLACYKAINEGLKVSHLLNMLNEDAKSSMRHEIGSELLCTQAQTLGIPIIQRSTTYDKYEDEFKKIVTELKQYGVTGVVFGDIALKEYRDWAMRVCGELEIKPLLPLWGIDRVKILNDFIKERFEAIIVSAKADLFDDNWIGHKVDSELIKYLNENKIDLCGEHGEYHTYVTNGPIFKKRIEIFESKKIVKDFFNKQYRFLHILRHKLV